MTEIEDSRVEEIDGCISKIDKYMKLLNKFHLQHNWDHVLKGFHAEDITNFKRFITLKSIIHDFDATILSPTARIDAVWHHLLLRPKEYVALCTCLNPPILDKYEMVQHCIIDHNPDGGSEVQRAKRLENTYELFMKYFQINLKINKRKAENEKETEDFYLIVRWLEGNTVMNLLVDKNKSIYSLKRKIQDLKVINLPANFYLFFDGNKLSEQDSLSDCDIQEQDTIDIIPRLSGY
jgi:hypothetical protein